MYDTLPEKEGRIFISGYQPSNVMPKQVNISQTGKVSTRWTGVQRWDFNLQIEAFGHEEIRELNAFLISHIDTPFYISLPLFQSSALSNSTVNAKALARSNSVNISGHRGIIQAGDYLTFLNHPKLYTATNTVKTSGTLVVSPPLRADVNVGEAVILQDVKILVRCTSDIKTSIDDVDWVATFEIEVKEA
ncbi:hypothetical protein ACV1C8_00030 [Aeromonas hydrophila]|uniref:hypothetical protein n=1 Tax=Aeromonas hydrophila TaxID=644 RepID=UPI00259F0894|nr:hypothetical protein [Aeromonas hydrophila]MDM5121032.1 hypothetical protein [Aeromonas hydrophila]